MRHTLIIAVLMLFALTGSANADRERPYNRFICGTLSQTLPSDGPFSRFGVAGPLTGNVDGVFVLGGGTNFEGKTPWHGGVKRYYDVLYTAEKSQDGLVWQEKVETLPFSLAYPALASTGDRRFAGLYVLGGENESGRLDNVLRLSRNGRSNRLQTETLASLPVATSNAVTGIIGNMLYLVGGDTAEGPSDRLWALDLTNPRADWRPLSPLPRRASHSVAVVQSDGNDPRLYVFGGRAKLPGDSVTAFFDTVYSYLPRTGEWKEHAPMPVRAAAGCGVSSGYCSVILFPAAHEEFFNGNERALAQIAAEDGASARPDEKSRLLTEYDKRIESFEGFPRDYYLFDTITERWIRLGETDFAMPVTTTAFWWDGKIVFPSGEIKPAHRTPEINALTISSPKHGFGLINYAVLGVYFFGMLLLGGAFASRNAGAADFFRGGGRIPWWALGISIFATALSPITFLSMPAKAYATDWRMIFFNFGILMVVPIVVAFYLPYFRNLKLETAYEFLERRFNRASRLIASGLFCVFMVSRIAVVLFLPSLALSIVTDVDIFLCIILLGLVTLLYCTMGGMEAVVWADVVQGAILVFGAVFCLVFLVMNTDGGVAGFVETGLEMRKFRSFDFSWDMAQPIFIFVLLGGFANSLITYSSDQTIIQRYMSTKNTDQAVKSIWLNAFLSIPITIVFFLLGTALYTYYRSRPLEIDVVLKNTDAVFPHYIVNTLPPGLSGLLIAAIFSAAMSTLSSNINSVSAALTSDFIKGVVPNLSVKAELRTARITGIVAGCLGIGLALLLAVSDITSLWDQFNTFLGLFMSAIGGLFLMGVFSKRINGAGALVGLLVSFGTILWLRYFTNLSFLMYGAIGMPVCYVAGWLVSALIGFSHVKHIELSETENTSS